MKKFMIMLALAGTATASYAQMSVQSVEVMEVPVDKYSVETNDFWSNWFISAGGDYMSTALAGDSWSNLFFKDHQYQWGFNVAVGKWFTPGLGLRAKFNGLKGRNDNHTFDLRAYRAEAMFNLSNLFAGYNPTRVWNMSILAGGGNIAGKTAIDFGLHSNWQLSERVGLYLEAALFFADRHGKMLKLTDSYDKYMDISAGITFNLGNTGFDRSPDVESIMLLNAAEIDALNVALAEQQEQNQQLKNQLAQKPKEVVKKQTVVQHIDGAPQSIFFNIGQSVMASPREVVNLQAIADMVKGSQAKVSITGYADSATGSPEYNQQLSKKRAETVAAELEKMGVSRANMIVEGKGGVDELNPDSFNRRVIIEISK